MTLMEVAVDPLAFTNWVQVAALFIIVAGGVVVMWMRNFRATTKDTNEKMTKVADSLFTNNGGSHIKDQLDRLEQGHAEHLSWSREFAEEQKQMHEKLDKSLEGHEKKLETIWKHVSPTEVQDVHVIGTVPVSVQE
jgi:flagellar motor component MotA